MNIKNLRHLREKLLELDNESFNMEEYRNECGTVCCLAGWAVTWFYKFDHLPVYSWYAELFEEIIDVDSETTENLNILHWLTSARWAENFNTIEHAVKRIDYLLEHGSPPEDYSYLWAESYYDGVTKI